jgi:hypothetical protein
VDGGARPPKRLRVPRKLQPLVAAWLERPSRTVASLLGHGPGFSAKPCPAMRPGHYGEVWEQTDSSTLRRMAVAGLTKIAGQLATETRTERRRTLVCGTQ